MLEVCRDVSRVGTCVGRLFINHASCVFAGVKFKHCASIAMTGRQSEGAASTGPEIQHTVAGVQYQAAARCCPHE